MLIIQGRIFIGDGREIEQGYVRIDEKGTIAQVGSMSELRGTDGEEIIEADGCLLTPGFIDGHSHIGMWEDSLGFEGDDGNEDTDPCTPHLRAIDAINPLERSFSEALAAGVTSVVTGPGSSNPIAGCITAMKTRGTCVDEMVIRENVGIKFALGENPKAAFHAKTQSPVTRMAIAALIREQLQKARRYMEDKAEAEADEELEMPEFDAKCEALIPLLKRECRAHFHAHRADDIYTALRIAREFDLDYLLIHCTEGHLIADELRRAGAGVITGPMFCTRTKPELSHYTPATSGVLAAAGVEVAVCTDHPELPVQYLALSAGLAAAEGMDRIKALMAITSVPAHLCGIDHRVGTIRAGLDADLLIFDRDPFAVGTRPKIVMVNGKICVDVH